MNPSVRRVPVPVAVATKSGGNTYAITGSNLPPNQPLVSNARISDEVSRVGSGQSDGAGNFSVTANLGSSRFPPGQSNYISVETANGDYIVRFDY